MRRESGQYPVATLCRVLDVSTSGYYAWLTRSPSDRDLNDEWLLARIREAHAFSKATYGAPRILEELRAQGVRVSKKRIARLMRRNDLQGVSRRRRGRKTTIRDPKAQPALDLVCRNFTAKGPDQLWVSDITYVPTYSGFLFLAVVMDAFSRRVIGWSMAEHLRTELVLDALEMALHARQPSDVICHSDHGCQYTSLAFGKRCREAGVRPSMGAVGSAYDNAMCESFFATLECELLDRRKFHSRSEAKMAIFTFIEGWYNPSRRHSGIDYLSPMEYERRYMTSA